VRVLGRGEQAARRLLLELRLGDRLVVVVLDRVDQVRADRRAVLDERVAYGPRQGLGVSAQPDTTRENEQETEHEDGGTHAVDESRGAFSDSKKTAQGETTADGRDGNAGEHQEADQHREVDCLRRREQRETVLERIDEG